MAKDEPADDKEEEGEGEAEQPKKKGKLLKIIIISVSALVLIGGIVGGTMYFTGAFSGHEGDAESTDSADAADAADTGDHKGDEPAKDKKGKKDSKKKSKSPPTYYAFDPAFIVNFVENNQIRYLQVTLEIMTHDAAVVEDIKTHMPVIRNNLVLVFSNQTYDTLSTAAGKQKLRDEALAELQQILKNETGKPGVEAVYFTSFVMQ